MSLHQVACLIAACVLAGCGGSDAPPSRGEVFPPVQGLVMVEYDANGLELQRSTATDERGRFMFDRALSGRRVESVQPHLQWEAATTRSALISSSPEVLFVSPVTTLIDQWVAGGSSEEDARSTSVDMVQRSCGQAAFSLDDTRILDGTAAIPEAVHPVALALAAYLNALRDVGVDPVAGRSFWRQEFIRYQDVLAASCSAGRQIYAPEWMLAMDVHLAGRASLTQSVDPAIAADARQTAASEVLRLVAARVAQARYPELAAPTALGPPWDGSPAEKALELAKAAVATQVLRTASDSAPDPAMHAVAYRLTRLGQVVFALAGVTLQERSLASVHLTNADGVDRAVRLELNGAVLGGLGTLLNEVLAFPQLTPDQTLSERVWRWAAARHRHQYPLTGGLMIHQPDLYFRSLGFGFCDDSATAMHWILTRLGIESRVVELGGHVVTEAKEYGRWVAYDTDLKIYYHLRDGRKAGVQDLADDPSLITNPYRPLVARTQGVYSTTVAQIYATKEDNWIPDLYATPPTGELSPEFTLPPGARLEIEHGATAAARTIDPSTIEHLPTVRLHLPPGYAGVIRLPLVLLDVTGEGSVRMFGRDVPVGGSEAAAEIASYYADASAAQTALGQVEVTQVGDGGLSLVMAVNPYYLERRSGLNVRLLSASPQSLDVRVVAPAPAS